MYGLSVKHERQSPHETSLNDGLATGLRRCTRQSLWCCALLFREPCSFVQVRDLYGT